jgi:uncharacterized protein (DUF885 family)
MKDVDDLFAEWMGETFEESPTLASALGLTDYDSQLGDFSADAFLRRDERDRRWAGRLAGLDLTTLNNDQQVDVALLASRLAEREVVSERKAWRREPELYLDPCLWGVFNLFLHRLRPEAELVAAAISRLGQIPEVLAAATANLDPELASPLILERSLGAARGGVAFLRDALPAEVSDEGLRRDVAEAAETASASLAAFAEHLSALVGRAQGDWALGEGHYSDLLRRRELLGYGAAELHRMGEAAWKTIDAEMTELAGRMRPGGPHWRELIHELAAHHPDSAEQMRQGYADACDHARAFLAERGLVTLPEGEQCLVVASPAFLRPILAVASYVQPPEFSSSVLGHFFVPWPTDDMSEKDLDERLRDNSWADIPTIAVHEAYPGHHWHMTWSGKQSRPLRKVITTPYFIEGWALYAEAMMRDQGYFTDPAQELCHLNARIFRAARIVVDTALHTGEMSREEAVAYMTSHTGLTDSVARAEVDRYCAWPTQAASYLTGAIEIERLAGRWINEGRGDLRGFHDAIASSCGLPIPLAERALFGR